MNNLIQNILVISTLVVAVLFLLKKFVFKGKKSSKKSCGNGDCGC
ncbi:FeoB-associated Cys-rich membrane protein [Tamlana sp. PT2-4]|uniref:FeoB-associated Cys-rich membrane protein n=1 Tax=Neotamlana laminarinivorans TaxID=2883124 RepID=A0A9X1L479_9FLAO|nr:FeoB-associated Cys-rich membrane protein [Tamlana laminarinivorans]MCB4798041.1 FeoB-associated Cys-rich membrane protein [Tamlana laminarinivorans]